MKPNRSLHVYYAEDVRQEANGQISVIGIFADAIGVAAFPTTFGKLAVLLDVTTATDRPFQKLSFEVKTDEGKILAEATLPVSQLRQQDEAVAKHVENQDEAKIISLRLQVVMAGVTIENATKIRVVVKTEDEEDLISRPLRIQKDNRASVTVAATAEGN